MEKGGGEPPNGLEACKDAIFRAVQRVECGGFTPVRGGELLPVRKLPWETLGDLVRRVLGRGRWTVHYGMSRNFLDHGEERRAGSNMKKT